MSCHYTSKAFCSLLPGCTPAPNRIMHVPGSGGHERFIREATSINEARSWLDVVV